MAIRWMAMIVVLSAISGIGPAVAQDDESALSVDPSLMRPDNLEMTLPEVDPANGRALFVDKGCVICHAVNNVGGNAIRDLGGKSAPSLDISRMPLRMDPFEFFARMWSGAKQMIALQEEGLGYQIKLKSDEMADIMAFLYSESEQAKFTTDSFVAPIFWYRDTDESAER